MAFKISKTDRADLCDRIASLADEGTWEDLAWALADYLPLEVHNAVCDWAKVPEGPVALTIEELEDLSWSVDEPVVVDDFGRRFRVCMDCYSFHYVDPNGPFTFDEDTMYSAAYMYDWYGPLYLEDQKG